MVDSFLICWIVDLWVRSKGAMSWTLGSKSKTLGGCGCLGGAALCPCRQNPASLRGFIQVAQARVMLRPPEEQESGSPSREVELRVDCSLGCWIVDLPVHSRGAVRCPAAVQTQNPWRVWLSGQSCPLTLQPAPRANLSMCAGGSG